MNVISMKHRKAVRTAEQIKASPHFAKLSANQKDFVLAIAAGADSLTAMAVAYHFKSEEAARQHMYCLLRQRTMQPILCELYGKKFLSEHDKEVRRQEFLQRLDKLIRQRKPSQAEVALLITYGCANGFVPANFKFTQLEKA
jgi:hypothetical protein